MRLREQSGNMSLLALGGAVGLAGILLIMLSFYQVWLTHMRSEQIADAAASGALEYLRPGLRRVLEEQLNDRLMALWRAVDASVAQRLAEWERAYRSRRAGELGADGELSPEDEERIDQEVAELVPERERQYRDEEVRRRHSAIADGLLARYRRDVWSVMDRVPLPSLVQEFLEGDDLGCAVLEAGRRYRSDMAAGAGRFARANGADMAGAPEVRTRDGEPGVEATVVHRLRVLVAERYLAARQRQLPGRSRVSIRAIAGVRVTVPAHCP